MDEPTDLFSMDDFRRPGYLVDWLSIALKKNEGGFFHLELDAGMGKSAFARALDPTRRTGNGAIDLADTTVRTYCVDSPLYASFASYCNALPLIFNRDAGGEAIFEQGDVCFSSLRCGSPDAAYHLTNLLRSYRDAFRQYYGTSRLLFVVDALEDCPEGEALRILDSLPGPDFFSEGVYVLLTTRPAEELPPRLAEAVARREVTEHFKVDRRHPEFLDGLRSYAHDPLRGGRDAARGIDADATKLMAILASAYEPLTLEEIASLCGGDWSGSRLLAGFAPLRPFLATERDLRGEVLFLRPEWKAAGKRALHEPIRGLVEGWIRSCGEASSGMRDAPTAGRSYLLAHLTDYAAEYGFDEPLRDAAIAALLAAAAEEFKGNGIGFHAVERRFLMAGFAVGICERLRAMGQDVDELLALAYCGRGSALLARREEERALADCDRALDILQKLDEEGRLRDRGRLADVRQERGNVFKELHVRQFAALDFDLAIEIREDAEKDGPSSATHLLAEAYRARADFYRCEHDHGYGVDDYSRVVEILEALDAEGALSSRDRLARAYRDRGDAYASADDGRAVDDYGRALAEAEKLRSEGGVPDRGFPASVYLSLGHILTRLHRMREAVAAWERFHELASPVDEVGAPFSPRTLAATHLSAGRAYDEFGQLEEAVAEFDRALEILSRMDAERRLLDRQGLAEIFRTRGAFFKLHGRPERAVAEYGSAIAVLEEMDRGSHYVDQNVLVNLYFDRGAAILDQDQPERALADLEKAVRWMAIMDEDAELRDRRDLAEAYMRRGDAFDRLGKIEAALRDYSETVEVLYGLDKGSKTSDPWALKTAYVRVGSAFARLGEPESAAYHQNRAVEIATRIASLSMFTPRGRPGAAAANAARKNRQEEAWLKDRALFMDRIRDSVLGRRAWRRLGAAETAALRLERNPTILGSSVASSGFQAIRFELPFFPDASLLELHPEGANGSLWLLDRGSLAILDGSSGAILDAGAAGPIELTQDNVVEYLRFYSFFVHRDGWPHFIVDDLSHPILDAPRLQGEDRELMEKELHAPRLIAGSDSGPYRIEAFAVYGAILLQATFEVGGDGRVEATDEKHLIMPLPIRDLRFYRD